MLARWLRLWFGFTDRVDWWTYLRHGLGLMVFKYGVDALLVWRFTGRFWTPLSYLSPLLSTRAFLFEEAPDARANRRTEHRRDPLLRLHDRRLEGRTRYVVDMFPQPYWTLPARAIVTAIHARVLHHIQTLSEEAVH